MSAVRSGAALDVPELVPGLSLLLLLSFWALLPGLLERWIYIPLLLSTVLFGIPHGALDHRLPALLGWTWAERPSRVFGYLLGYAVGAALVFSLWWLVPPLVFWGFLLMSLLHWGQGDLYHLETAQGRRRSGPWSAPLTLLARGSLPILLPLLAFPEWFARLGAGVGQVVGRPAPVGPLLSPMWQFALGGVLLFVLIGYLADVKGSSRRPALEVTETAILVLVFSVVPPPLSIGVYFSLWHAWRHLARLLSLSGTGQRTTTDRVLQLARDLTPITGVALGVLALLFVWAAPRVPDVQVFAALYLALIAGLTAPHALLVACMGNAPARR